MAITGACRSFTLGRYLLTAKHTYLNKHSEVLGITKVPGYIKWKQKINNLTPLYLYTYTLTSFFLNLSTQLHSAFTATNISSSMLPRQTKQQNDLLLMHLALKSRLSNKINRLTRSALASVWRLNEVEMGICQLRSFNFVEPSNGPDIRSSMERMLQCLCYKLNWNRNP